MFKPKKVVFIGTDWPENEKYCPHFLGVKAGLKKMDIPFRFVSCRPTLNIAEIVSYKPDLVIYGVLDMIKNPKWRHEIREKLPHAKIVNWYGDFRDTRMIQVDADCSEMDAMFVSNNTQEERYKWKWKMKEVHFLPLGCEPIPKPLYNPKFAFPFVFIGGQIMDGPFHPRASMIEDFKVKGGLTLINSYDAQLRAKVYRAMPEIYSSAKVCLDISHFTDVRGYTSIRFWEIPAYFGFALTKRWPGCEDFYQSDSHAYFDTFEEALELKDYYLNHESERLKMVERAHKLSYNHDYKSRFERMFALL